MQLKITQQVFYVVFLVATRWYSLGCDLKDANLLLG